MHVLYKYRVYNKDVRTYVVMEACEAGMDGGRNPESFCCYSGPKASFYDTCCSTEYGAHSRAMPERVKGALPYYYPGESINVDDRYASPEPGNFDRSKHKAEAAVKVRPCVVFCEHCIFRYVSSMSVCSRKKEGEKKGLGPKLWCLRVYGIRNSAYLVAGLESACLSPCRSRSRGGIYLTRVIKDFTWRPPHGEAC